MQGCFALQSLSVTLNEFLLKKKMVSTVFESMNRPQHTVPPETSATSKDMMDVIKRLKITNMTSST